MEIGSLDLIVSRVNEDDISALKRITEKMRKSASGPEVIILDWEFHRTLIGVSGNAVLVEFGKVTDAFFESVIRTQKSSADDSDAYRHDKIIKLLEDRDLEALRQEMYVHGNPSTLKDEYENDIVNN